MSGIYGYDWFVGGMSVLSLPSNVSEERSFIECPRGTKAGKACFYLREADALTLLASGAEVTIRCAIKKKAPNDLWVLEKNVQWVGYIPTEMSEIDDSGNCWVTFRDKRIQLERAAIDVKFNSLFLMTWEIDGTTQYKFYDAEYCNTLNTPYTFDQILDTLFNQTTLTAPSLPVSPSPPDNIHCHGTVADALSGLLATLGCDLLYDPFSGDLSIVLLSDSQDTGAVDAALAEGRLVHQEQFTLSDDDRHGVVVIWPREWFPIRNVESDTGSFGVGERTILIRDHELADETSKTVGASRKADIVDACEAWFTAESDLRDESYYGVIEQSPGEEIRVVQWWLPHSSDDGYMMTRIVNNAVPMPWITRVENTIPTAIRGSATGTGLGTTTPELFFYWASVESGGYVNSGYYAKGVSTAGEIPAYSDLIAWATEYKWLALEICGE